MSKGSDLEIRQVSIVEFRDLTPVAHKAANKIAAAKVNSGSTKRINSFTPLYNHKVNNLLIPTHKISTPGGHGRYRYVIKGISRPEAREILKRNNIGLCQAQIATIRECLGYGAAKSVNIKITQDKVVKLSIERPGFNNGFQRMSYEIKSDGNKGNVIQTAFDNNRRIVRQEPGAIKNNIYDIKKKKR